MKLAVVNVLLNTLAGVKIMKVKDKDVRTTLLNDFLHLRSFSRKSHDRQQGVIDKFNADWKDADKNGTAYQNAINDLNEIVGEMLNEDVETSLKAVPLSSLMESGEADALNLEQIGLLLECGVLKDE